MLDKDYLIKGDMYQYNLGWLIDTILSFKSDLETAIDLKTIKYADPIEWNITTQYAANTVVVDPKSGTAYMSKTAVPSGILLDNTTYWVVVFNYQEIYNKIMDGVAFNDRKNDYASHDLVVNDLVWYAGDLYRVTKDIPNGAKYIIDTNISKISIESLLKNYLGNDRTASVNSDKLTASGDITEEAANKSVTVSGDLTIKAGDLTEDLENKTVTASGDITEEAAEIKLKSSSLVLDSNGEPLKLGMTAETSDFYDKISVRDSTANVHKIMLENDKTNYFARKTAYNTTNVVIIGDSFAGTWYSGYESYAYQLKTMLNINTLHVYSIGGAGFLARGTLSPYSNVTFQEYLDAAYNAEMQKFADSVTLVIIQGGGNDFNQDRDAEKAAVINLITDIKSKFKNADICGVTGFWLHNMYINTKDGIVNGFNAAGVNLLPAFYAFINRTSWFNDDKLHPNATGMAIMAAAVANYILYGATYDSTQRDFISVSGGGVIWTVTNDGLFNAYVITSATDTICAIPKALQPNEDNNFSIAYNSSGALVLLWYNSGYLKVYSPSGSVDGTTTGTIQWMLNANSNNESD